MSAKSKLYDLPTLEYDYKDLSPYMSEEQLRIHYGKHHQAYVNNANQLLHRLDVAREEHIDLDMKATLKDLSFQLGGHVMHSLFWASLAPDGKGGSVPNGILGEALAKEFGSFDRFKQEFAQTAASVEGSGWAALAYCRHTERPLILQIEKHNVNVVPQLRLLLALDVFEHAYYLDYKNDRGKYIEAFWNIANWDEANKRLEHLLG